MRNFFSLVKVQLLSMFGLNKLIHSKRRKFLTGMAGFVFVVILLIVAIAFYGYTFGEILAMALALSNNLEALIPTMIALSAVVGFMFAFFATGNVLYGFKDYDLLTSMPLKNSEIVLSKLVYIYLGDLAFAILFCSPSVYLFDHYGGTLSIGFIASYVCAIIFTPLLPLALSVVVGALIAVVSSLFKKKNLIQTIFLFLFMAAMFGIGFISGNEGSADLSVMVAKAYFILPILTKALSDPISLLIFVAINVSSITIVSTIVCMTYKKFNTLIRCRKRRSKFTLGSYSGRSAFSSLYRRETARLFSCPTYIVNGLLGAIMCILATVAFVFIIPSVPEIASFGGEVLCYVCALYSFCLILAPTTSCAISLEGGAFWIVRTVPVKTEKIFKSKIAVCLTYYLPSAFVSALVISILLKASALLVCLFTLLAVAISVLAAFSGLFLNILFPKMKWDNENQAIKQSASVFVTTLAAMVVSGIFIACSALIEVDPAILLSAFAAFAIVLDVVLYLMIFRKGEKILYKKI